MQRYPGGRPAGRPKPKLSLAGRPAGINTDWPAGRARNSRPSSPRSLWFPRPGAIEPLNWAQPVTKPLWAMKVVCNLGSSDLPGWVQPHCGWSNHEAWISVDSTYSKSVALWMCGISWTGLKVRQLQSTKPPVFQTFPDFFQTFPDFSRLSRLFPTFPDFSRLFPTFPDFSRLFRPVTKTPFPEKDSIYEYFAFAQLEPHQGDPRRCRWDDARTWGPTNGKRGPRRALDFCSHDWIYLDISIL